jgi:hypothetical protein
MYKSIKETEMRLSLKDIDKEKEKQRETRNRSANDIIGVRMKEYLKYV